jgi:hypothetical protein
VFFFFGRIIGYRVTPVLDGSRSVLDLLTHKSNFDDKHWKFPIGKEWQQKRKKEVQERNKGKMREYDEEKIQFSTPSFQILQERLPARNRLITTTTAKGPVFTSLGV